MLNNAPIHLPTSTVDKAGKVGGNWTIRRPNMKKMALYRKCPFVAMSGQNTHKQE